MELTGDRANVGSIVKAVTPTVDTNIYASGDRLGSIQEINNALGSNRGCAILKSLTIVDASKQTAAIDVLFFSDKPVVTSADNAPIDISDSEMAAKYLGHVSIAGGDYQTLLNNTAACVKNIQLALNNSTGSSQSIWAVPVVRSTPTYAASDLTFKYGLA